MILRIHKPALTRAMFTITFLGNPSFLVTVNLVLIAVLILLKNYKAALTAAAVALSSLGIMSLLKNIFRRHRPDLPLIEGITNFSFPSGHAFMSVAFYGLLIWLTAKYIPAKIVRQFFIIFFVIIILLIGFSRIYLRVHYTTDVLAGFCMGTAWLIVCLALMETLQENYAAKRK